MQWHGRRPSRHLNTFKIDINIFHIEVTLSYLGYSVCIYQSFVYLPLLMMLQSLTCFTAVIRIVLSQHNRYFAYLLTSGFNVLS